MQEDVCGSGAGEDVMVKSNRRAAGEGDVIEGTRSLVGVLRKGEDQC